MSTRFSLGLLAIVLLAVVVGVAAGKQQPRTSAAPAPTSTPTPIPTPRSGHIDIVPNASGNPVALYRPATFTVRVKHKVTWTNQDSQPHTVTADNGGFSSSPLDTNQTFSWTPKKPGTYAYGCYIHPDMRGVIIVKR